MSRWSAVGDAHVPPANPAARLQAALLRLEMAMGLSGENLEYWPASISSLYECAQDALSGAYYRPPGFTADDGDAFMASAYDEVAAAGAALMAARAERVVRPVQRRLDMDEDVDAPVDRYLAALTTAIELWIGGRFASGYP